MLQLQGFSSRPTELIHSSVVRMTNRAQGWIIAIALSVGVWAAIIWLVGAVCRYFAGS
jgi:hypothetical protein